MVTSFASRGATVGAVQQAVSRVLRTPRIPDTKVSLNGPFGASLHNNWRPQVLPRQVCQDRIGPFPLPTVPYLRSRQAIPVPLDRWLQRNPLLGHNVQRTTLGYLYALGEGWET